MTPEAPHCEQCKQPMEAGYLVDHSYGTAYPASWVAGTPKWSRWTGLKLDRKAKMPVTTYRCPQCGRLTSIAMPGKWP